jgi:hypothetical protein
MPKYRKIDQVFKIFRWLYSWKIILPLLDLSVILLLLTVYFNLPTDNSSGFFLIMYNVFMLKTLAFFGVKVGKRLTPYIQKAKVSQAEISREDDVLLQGATFSSAILFFYVNLMLEDKLSKLILSILIVAFAGSFYISRAVAKIKDSPKLRYYSIYLFATLLMIYLATLIRQIYPYFQILTATYYTTIGFLIALPLIYTVILFREFVGIYFKARYGA